MENSLTHNSDQFQFSRVVVTGAAGYIGRAICKRLQEQNRDVLGLDIHHGDLTTENICLNNCRAVVHLAANPSVIFSIQNPATDARSIIAAIRVAESAMQAGCRFVFASSCAVYGNDHAAFVGSDLKPISPYGIAKRAAEEYLRWFASRGLKVSIVRLGNVYGGDDTRGVWHRFQSAKNAGELATVYGDGSATRSYVSIEQTVEALIDECEQIEPFRLRNLGGTTWSVNEIADAIGVQTIHKPARQGEASNCVLI